MAATRSMAGGGFDGSAAEFHHDHAVEHPFRVHQLGIEHGRSGRAANGIVAQRDEFPVEHRAGTQAADEGRHAALAFGIFARLRAVGFCHIMHRVLRRAGQVALLRHGREGVERVAQIGLAGLGGKFNRDGDGVAIDHRHAIAVRAHFGGQRLNVVAAKVAQDLLRLLLHLFFFAADERNHIAHDVHGGTPG